MGGLFSSPPILLSVTKGQRRLVALNAAALCSGMENQEHHERCDDNSNDDEDHGRAGEARSLLRRQDGRIHGPLDAD
jgi:hypothetical protein